MSSIPRSRKAMIEYLRNHFRYFTMHSWNQATSYAANVKVTRFVPDDLVGKALDLLDVDGALDRINELICDWDDAHDYEYQVGWNGRSSGYLVMYTGGRRGSEYKTICHACGQKNYRADTTKCGACGEEDMHEYHGQKTYTYPGKGIDQDEDFEAWDTDSLRERVKLVRSFDKLVEDCKAEYISLCRNYTVEEETVMVPRKVKVLVEA